MNEYHRHFPWRTEAASSCTRWAGRLRRRKTSLRLSQFAKIHRIVPATCFLETRVQKSSDCVVPSLRPPFSITHGPFIHSFVLLFDQHIITYPDHILLPSSHSSSSSSVIVVVVCKVTSTSYHAYHTTHSPPTSHLTVISLIHSHSVIEKRSRIRTICTRPH